MKTYRGELKQQSKALYVIEPANESGSAPVVVRWIVETPSGWVGAWDKDALEDYALNGYEKSNWVANKPSAADPRGGSECVSLLQSFNED